MQLAGINLELLNIVDTGPGEYPTVSFNVTNNAGEQIDPSSLSFRLMISGPNTDFSYLNQEDAAADSVIADGGYAYTFKNPIPDDATGSFTVGIEGYHNAVLNAGTTKETTIREASSENPTMAFAVTDSAPVPRRHIVDDQKCDACHDNLALHGGIRHDPSYCVMCHQPGADDSPYRAEDDFPARSIDFKFMIHRIHTGEELEQDYTIIGFRGTPHNYNEVLFPGNRKNCEMCHVDDSFNVPTPGILPTIEPYEYFSPIQPNASACLACHDSLDAAAHAWINTAPFGESCGVCHGEGSEQDVAKVHAL
jgi:OmcA/MtrC family decaheme c-type cytochrome